MSQWMQKYAAETLRFVEFERQALPCALIRQSTQAHAIAPKGKKTKDKKSKGGKSLTEGGGGGSDGMGEGEEVDPRPPLSFTAADMEARSVMEQRLQSLVCCCSMVSQFLSAQHEAPGALEQEWESASVSVSGGASERHGAPDTDQASTSATPPPPMSVMPTLEAIDAVWQVLQPLPRLMHRHMVQLSTLKATKPAAAVKAKAKAPKKKAKPVATAVATTVAVAVAPAAAGVPTQNQDLSLVPEPCTVSVSLEHDEQEPSQQKQKQEKEKDTLTSLPPSQLLPPPLTLTTPSVSEGVSAPLPDPPSQCSSPSEGTPLDSTNCLGPPPPPPAATTTATLMATHDAAPTVTAPTPVDPNMTRIESAIADVKVVLSTANKPKSLAELRECIGSLQDTLSLLHDLASPTARYA